MLKVFEHGEQYSSIFLKFFLPEAKPTSLREAICTRSGWGGAAPHIHCSWQSGLPPHTLAAAAAEADTVDFAALRS